MDDIYRPPPLHWIIFTDIYTRGPSTLALLIALFIAPGPEYESAGHRDQNMKVLAHLHGQNTCVDILVDIINERFGVPPI